jgi:uncharacterized membrane protein YgcG
MQCPFCQTPLKADAAECPACRLTFPRTSALLGALPRLAPVVADTTRQLSTAEQTKLKKRIAEIQRHFPQLVLQVVVHSFPEEHPFSMHVFWLFNAGNFAGDSQRGKDNHALLVALDPTRGEAAIMPGYGLEPFLQRETLDHLLELAGPAWEASRWADGLFRVLEGLDQLLESVAIPDDGAAAGGEF